jgi:hypothetical protein
MSAVINTYNGTIQKADSTVLAIMTLNKLWIPDVLIDIIKDYLYISAYTVWRNFSRKSINIRITSLYYDWSNLCDTQGRVRLIHWSKGDATPESEIQIQCCVCVVCGESDIFHTNLDGCCRMEGDYHEDGQIELLEEEDDDVASYQGNVLDW